MKQIRWGFIGCGEVTEKKSGPAFNEVEGSCVVAVMSRNEERVKAYAKRHNIPKWYTDAQELVDDPDVNAVYIATPPSSHATYAIMCMRSGKPCYVEKPLAANYEDCIRVNRISEQTGVPCFVAYYRRYLPYFNKVRKLIATDSIGKVLTVQLQFAVPPRGSIITRRRRCPGVCNLTSPVVAISMTSHPISSICCKSSSGRSFVPTAIPRTASISMMLRTPSPLLSSSTVASRAVPPGVLWGMRVPRQTRSRSSATRVFSHSMCTTMTRSSSSTMLGRAVSLCPTRLTSNCRSSPLSSAICRVSTPAPPHPSVPRLSTG